MSERPEPAVDRAADHTPPLTEEELAFWSEEFESQGSRHVVNRLIADLRASRAEVERLQSLVDELTQAAHSHLP